MSSNRREEFFYDFLCKLEDHSKPTTIREILDIMNEDPATRPPFNRAMQTKLAQFVLNYLSKTNHLVVEAGKFCYAGEKLVDSRDLLEKVNKSYWPEKKLKKTAKTLNLKIRRIHLPYTCRVSYMGVTLAMSKDSQVTLLFPNGEQIAYDGKTLTIG